MAKFYEMHGKFQKAPTFPLTMQLVNFQVIRPPYESSQEDMLNWLVDAHTEAEKKETKKEVDLFREEFREKLLRVGCKKDQINQRGHILSDYLHRDWEKMSVYKLNELATGVNLDTRMHYYKKHADLVFEEFYQKAFHPPSDIIHVTCTGYASPSSAQKLVSKKGWGQTTTVTHAYHMGCYGAFAALRMAKGFLQSEKKKHADIVHTEICSLHCNPLLHEKDQLVSQSLFADGFIKYTTVKDADTDHFYVGNIREEIIPESSHAMTWDVAHWGHQMTLSKEVPVLIMRFLKEYLERLAQDTNQNGQKLCKEALFAIHPGGPKIISYVQKTLNLSGEQLHHTNQILQWYGNMSSATLPHIWERMLEDKNIPDATLIVSLAFGPGLSICGALLEKRCGKSR